MIGAGHFSQFHRGGAEAFHAQVSAMRYTFVADIAPGDDGAVAAVDDFDPIGLSDGARRGFRGRAGSNVYG